MSLPDRYYEDLLRQVVTGRGWLLAHDVLVPAARQAATLLDLGAASVFALGGSRGTGPIAEGIPTLDLGLVAGSMMEGIRASEALLDDLPPEIVARIDAWDPDREARAIRPLFSHGRPVAGRTTWGGRRPSWVALEDKTVIDALWDAAGVPRAPSRNVAVEADFDTCCSHGSSIVGGARD